MGNVYLLCSSHIIFIWCSGRIHLFSILIIMKTFIIRTFILGSIVILLLLSVVLLVPIQPNDYLQAYNLKCKLLEETESPRAIFIGGSNLAFGLDSQQIKDSLGINVINYGLHAGIGLKFMIDDIATYARKGDILVIAPEYGHFYTIQYGEPTTIAPIQAVCGWRKLHLLNFKQISNVIIGLPRIIEFIRPKNFNERSYTLSGFNKYGDEVKHWGLESIAIAEPGVSNHSFDYSFGEYFINKIENIKKERECEVLIVPPVCRESAFKAMTNKWNEVSSFLDERGYPFRVSPEHHALPDKYAYDTDYHMNYEGVKIYTASMIQILKPIIKKP